MKFFVRVQRIHQGPDGHWLWDYQVDGPNGLPMCLEHGDGATEAAAADGLSAAIADLLKRLDEMHEQYEMVHLEAESN